mmetsp:Transcript_13308/g.31748  ORF Transcript_13308/g.31748 Transcript_13308/m.31748 type:complete len:226 (+) Transcript_13308:2782-3459(+)
MHQLRILFEFDFRSAGVLELEGQYGSRLAHTKQLQHLELNRMLCGGLDRLLRNRHRTIHIHNRLRGQAASPFDHVLWNLRGLVAFTQDTLDGPQLLPKHHERHLVALFSDGLQPGPDPHTLPLVGLVDILDGTPQTLVQDGAPDDRQQAKLALHEDVVRHAAGRMSGRLLLLTLGLPGLLGGLLIGLLGTLLGPSTALLLCVLLGRRRVALLIAAGCAVGCAGRG